MLFPASLLLFWFFIAPHLPKAAIEIYHNAYQKWISIPLSITSHIPFSLGDELYFCALLGLLRMLLYRMRRRWSGWALKLLRGAAWITSLFYLGWGANYFRRPLHERLHYEQRRATPERALALYDALLREAERRRQQLDSLHLDLRDIATLNELIQEAYERLPFPLREASVPVFVKPSLHSRLMRYTGISGYFNPFTFEAQADVELPTVVLPFTLCHEAAHQYGVGPEGEANFYAYQAARHSRDLRFQYSAYFEALRYALQHLIREDPKRGRARLKALPPDIRSDLKRLEAFYERYYSKAYAVSDFLNDKYLKANRQKRGRKSYDSFYDLLLADFNRAAVYRDAAPMELR